MCILAAQVFENELLVRRIEIPVFRSLGNIVGIDEEIFRQPIPDIIRDHERLVAFEDKGRFPAGDLVQFATEVLEAERSFSLLSARSSE